MMKIFALINSLEHVFIGFHEVNLGTYVNTTVYKN